MLVKYQHAKNPLNTAKTFRIHHWPIPTQIQIQVSKPHNCRKYCWTTKR